MIEFEYYGRWSRYTRAKQHLLVWYHTVVQWIKIRLITKKDIMAHLGFQSSWRQRLLKEQIVSAKYFETIGGKDYE